MTASLLQTASLLAMLAFASVAGAQPKTAAATSDRAPILKALVLEAEAADAELAERIEGQLSGTSTPLERQAAVSTRASSLRQQVAEASRLAHAHTAQLVAWVDRRDGAVLSVLVVGDGRLVRRRLSEDGQWDSAVLEGAALLVRSTVQLVKDGELVGNEAELLVRQEEARSAPIAETRAGPTTSSKRLARPSRLEPSVALAASAGLVAIGRDQPANLQLTLAPELSWRGFRAVLAGTLGTSRQLDSTLGTLSLARHSLRLLAGYDVVSQPNGRIGVLLGPGVLIARRETLATAGGGAIGTSASSHLLPDLSCELRAALLVPGVRFRAGLFASVGGDVLLRSYRISAVVNGERRPILQLWPVQPRADVGLVFELR